ncbi:peptide ABC transporter permease [Reticulibacter mediterranei]|uniref:Peptide ABC transporter permease n=1 Tax=Reticulibacter mediterranei TaxID=2778369 RepID=A0A8J3IZH4_9CHLR|nr:ABC transporter permease [Reticulibacter mediterranei]GHO98091.1 peptide ABC transporter permease [Reticulibacter mediterranei]
MARYIAQRVFFIIPVALFVCFITFMIIHLVPGDPASVLLGEEATPTAVAALRHQLGLDQPLPTQFALWFWQLLHGNLGQSIQLQQPVLQAIWQRLPVTAELGVISLLYSLALAIPLGIYSATHRNTWLDWLVNVMSLLFTAIPGFILGLLLILFLAVSVRLFPPGGYVPFAENPAANLRDLILPVITLGTGAVAVNMRQIRASMIEVLHQDYVRTARAKGLLEGRVTYVHALRNAILPVLTIVGLQVGSIIAGAVVVETIFLWPGIGQLAVQSIFSKDYPVVQGIVLLAALSYMATNLLVDVGYVILDPRIRFEKQ